MKRLATLAMFVLALCVAAKPAVAQTSNPLSIYGYLTQGYGDVIGKPIYGMTDKSTTDYRAMALQFRYAPTTENTLVVQLGHRRLANSAIQTVLPDVSVDWAFVQKRAFGGNLKVGRIPMPRGLFNEVRQVGAIFPFFRASKAFYSEGVETIDGASASRGFDVGGGFGVDAQAYVGGYDLKLELTDTDGPSLITNKFNSSYGAHLLVSTPITGLRFSADRITGKNTSSEGQLTISTASGDLTRNRYFVRGEYEFAGSDDNTGTRSSNYVAWYSQAGVGITDKLWLNAQYEVNTLELFYLPLPAPFEYKNIQDAAYGMSYKVSPKMVLKGEYHDFTGYQLDVLTPPLNPATGVALPAGKTKYFILSVSTAF